MAIEKSSSCKKQSRRLGYIRRQGTLYWVCWFFQRWHTQFQKYTVNARCCLKWTGSSNPKCPSSLYDATKLSFRTQQTDYDK
mmetsp:Transcript_9807/g.29179  ORF Transcript_9807/g.29179 Transcript_9807/m.29179 type:complete len:82 (-) Transcript_9807:477-722(-)